MDINEFIESGILEEYCLGSLSDEDAAFVIQMSMLYPEIKAELTSIELSMERLAQATAVEVNNPELKNNILNLIDKRVDIESLPLIEQSPDHQAWLNTVWHLIPDKPDRAVIFHPLGDDGIVSQTLAIVTADVPYETHTDILESFLILKGECECMIGDQLIEACAGTLIEIPLFVPHQLTLKSPVLVAILQCQRL